MRNPANRKKYIVLFEVVKEDLTLLLSREAAEQMLLITVNYDKFHNFMEFFRTGLNFTLNTSQFSMTVLWVNFQETSLSKSTMMLNLCNVGVDVCPSL